MFHRSSCRHDLSYLHEVRKTADTCARRGVGGVTSWEGDAHLCKLEVFCTGARRKEQAYASILFTLSVYPPAFLSSLPGQNINQCLFRWKMASTHAQTHSAAENKTNLPVLLAACQLAARLCVQSRAKSLMRLGPLVQMKGTGKGAQSPSDCRRSISAKHILKICSCSGRQYCNITANVPADTRYTLGQSESDTRGSYAVPVFESSDRECVCSAILIMCYHPSLLCAVSSANPGEMSSTRKLRACFPSISVRTLSLIVLTLKGRKIKAKKKKDSSQSSM